MKKTIVVSKLKMMTGSYAKGNMCRFMFSVTAGLDGRPWAVLSPDEGAELTDAEYLRAANYMLKFLCRPPEDVIWFRSQSEDGLLEPEFETMNLIWSDMEGRYVNSEPCRMTRSEWTWLRVMGVLSDAQMADVGPRPHISSCGT